jgi:uncharacterized protein (TIGR02145 family)
MIMKHINKLSIIIFSIITYFESSIAFAQAPEKMSYQSVLRGTNNALVTNQNVRVKISILQGTITGSAAYVEEHTTNTNSNGLVSLSIGGGTLISGNFSTINWANGPYFVKMEADPTGGTNYTISGTTQLLSVPYALHAKTADNGIDRFSTIGDTLFLKNGNYMIIPGISLANITSIPSLNVLYNGYNYPTIKLGNGQEWFAENLKTTQYNDGSLIPLVSDSNSWADNYNNNAKQPMMCWFNNDQTTYSSNNHGALYNWYSIHSSSNGNKNICPIGWRVPNNADWITLRNYLGNSNSAASKLKSSTGWLNEDGTNQSGFNSLPIGRRSSSGEFLNVMNSEIEGAFYWSLEQLDTDIAWFLFIQDHVTQSNTIKYIGLSVRCIKE